MIVKKHIITITFFCVFIYFDQFVEKFNNKKLVIVSYGWKAHNERVKS